MTTTPHHVGQIAKAQLLIADRLEAWGLTDPNDRAAWLLQKLQDAGWKSPPDPNADVPPLTGPAELDGPGYREFAAARAALAARRTSSDT